MEYVWGFLRCLVDVAGPPDQPAFLAPVSPTRLKFAASVRDRENGDLDRSVRPLGSLDHSAACDHKAREPNEKESSVREHIHLLRPRRAWERNPNQITSVYL
jgi:hypothetical protein